MRRYGPAWGLIAGIGCGGAPSQVVTVAPPSIPVLYEEVKAGELDETWTMTGVVRAASYATVAAQVPGEVRRVDVVEGAMVEQGAAMLLVDDAAAQASLARFKAEAELAAANGDGRAPWLRARVDELGVELVRHEIKAPFRGIVARRYVDPGDWVFPGDPCFDLVTLGEVEVVLDGPPELVGDVQPGATATLVGRNKVLGEVMAIIPVRDVQTGMVRVRVRPAEPRDWLIHGAEVGVQLPLTRTAEGVVVPVEAVVDGEVGPEVVRIAGDRAVRVPVVRLAWSDDAVLVRAPDLRAGEEVVVTGPDRLRTGQLIRRATAAEMAPP
jgi:membrane fusion protein (multidrug efflux system)